VLGGGMLDALCQLVEGIEPPIHADKR